MVQPLSPQRGSAAQSPPTLNGKQSNGDTDDHDIQTAKSHTDTSVDTRLVAVTEKVNSTFFVLILGPAVPPHRTSSETEPESKLENDKRSFGLARCSSRVELQKIAPQPDNLEKEKERRRGTSHRRRLGAPSARTIQLVRVLEASYSSFLRHILSCSNLSSGIISQRDDLEVRGKEVSAPWIASAGVPRSRQKVPPESLRTMLSVDLRSRGHLCAWNWPGKCRAILEMTGKSVNNQSSSKDDGSVESPGSGLFKIGVKVRWPSADDAAFQIDQRSGSTSFCRPDDEQTLFQASPHLAIISTIRTPARSHCN